MVYQRRRTCVNDNILVTNSIQHLPDPNKVGVDAQTSPIKDNSTTEELTEIRVRIPKKQHQKATKSEPKSISVATYYDAKLTQVRKQAPSFSWGVSKTQRKDIPDCYEALMTIGKRQEIPGPGEYNQQQTSIGMAMMKTILEQEQNLRNKVTSENTQKMSMKMSQKAKMDYALKKERHLMKKKYFETKVQPGAHQDIFRHSDFVPLSKKDYH